ncbi:MAG: hypothetical protein ACRYGR_00455 [Janthinobacterium lividum]
MFLNNRLKNYTQLSKDICCLTDIKLCDLISKSKNLNSSIGGESHVLMISDISVFVKKISLTDLENQSEHILKTANLFKLPLFYQYGVGSTGFGAWRELAAHIITTDWVLKKECPNFPLLYHWRILSNDEPKIISDQKLKNDVEYWEGSLTIGHRIESLHQASSNIILFLEYAPQTLYEWLSCQLKIGGSTAESAISFVDKNLKLIINFMNKRGLVHFDAHFHNILTDGEIIYLSDFGLSLSSEFDLTSEEIDFLKAHRTYDRCATIVNLLHCLITSSFGKDQWEKKLKEYVDQKLNKLSPPIDSIITKYSQIALVMDKFYQNLQKKTKLTPYPAAQLEYLLSTIGEEST